MERIFRHKDGTLYIQYDELLLKSVFRLQMVSPLAHTVDISEFEQALEKGEVIEYTPAHSFEEIPIEWYQNDFEVLHE